MDWKWDDRLQQYTIQLVVVSGGLIMDNNSISNVQCKLAES